MAKSGNVPASSGGGFAELRSRLLFVLLAIVVYRIGAHVPVPGIDSGQLAVLFNANGGTILGMFNMFSGGALERMSVFALGIMPYISASIIMQLMTVVSPSLEQLKKEGEAGRRKITQYTRYATLVLAVIQAVGMSVGLVGGGAAQGSATFYLITVSTFVAGAMFLMWLGEQVTEKGIGNGISLIIFAGIVASLPQIISNASTAANNGNSSVNGALSLLGMGLLALITVAFVVFIERGQRRIKVTYPRRQVGNKMYAGQNSYLPMKVNMAGVIPAIFAQSILLFMGSVAQWLSNSNRFHWMNTVSEALKPGATLYVLLFTAAVVFFCFFYTALVFNPKDVADNLKKSGAFLPGIRPGEQTARYVDKVMTRLTLFGAAYIAFVSLLPQLLAALTGVSVQLGGTSVLIVVVVVMDFMSQVQAQLMSNQYESVMKKANLKGH
ncbi:MULTISPECIES: preprotein translocase subunit SecY [Zymobacter]|uniref:Protein translocase subunit SecY n=1 Tax=Zymobacter palmae TaxID=33074 RepID=A0A348HBX1_9GAMM|nr:preprotein translocase subunit SecY [Zymobacter palmae]BBG29123.1 preprotein translocase subunit SecY [Zymobacter palmae]